MSWVRGASEGPRRVQGGIPCSGATSGSLTLTLLNRNSLFFFSSLGFCVHLIIYGFFPNKGVLWLNISRP